MPTCRFRRLAGVALALAAAMVLGACGTTLLDGLSAFDKGRYPEAKAVLARLARDYPQWDDAHRAKFALYAGLTHAELGDTAQAKRWLDEAKRLEDAHRGTLSADDWHRLQLGLEAIEPPLTPQNDAP
jgi:hypothetical protein